VSASIDRLSKFWQAWHGHSASNAPSSITIVGTTTNTLIYSVHSILLVRGISHGTIGLKKYYPIITTFAVAITTKQEVKK
jgi:hypothetical protein